MKEYPSEIQIIKELCEWYGADKKEFERWFRDKLMSTGELHRRYSIMLKAKAYRGVSSTRPVLRD